jgi:ribosomal protein L37AE/L43A
MAQKHCPRCAKLAVRRAGEREIWDCPDHGVIYQGPAPKAAAPTSAAEEAKPASASSPPVGTPRKLH